MVAGWLSFLVAAFSCAFYSFVGLLVALFFVALYRLFTLFSDLVVECFGFWDLLVWCVM